MPTIGIELCDVALQAAVAEASEVKSLSVADPAGTTDWPGFAYFDGQRFLFGRPAEDQWFVHPRRVTHSFWSRLAHEPSTIGPAGQFAAFSELAFRFFQGFARQLEHVARGEKVVLAVPGSYLKDPATEEEKIGLLLGISHELKLPLAGIFDLACAALCDSRAPGFNAALPVVVIDLHLDGAELTLFETEDKLERRDFLHLPQSGYAQLLKHLTGTMGNRFLRQTAFDILEDGRIEQSFFRQTKDFLLAGAPEHRFQINTATRTYEMLAKREQLAADSQAFVAALLTGLQGFLRNALHASEACTTALTDRAARLPGLEGRLQAAGMHRILHLPAGAAACGAARVGALRLVPASDLADVPVETSVPVSLARRAPHAWEARLHKLRAVGGKRFTPSHVILEGIGHSLGTRPRFTIGVAGLSADLPLPEAFNASDDCAVVLVRDGESLWYVDARTGTDTTPAVPPPRTLIEPGDRLVIRCGSATAELLFAHLPAGTMLPT